MTTSSGTERVNNFESKRQSNATLSQHGVRPYLSNFGGGGNEDGAAERGGLEAATVGQNSDRVLAVVTGDRHKFIQNPFLVRSSGLLVSHPDSQHHFLTSRLAQLPLHLPLPPTPAVAI
jgi:hypothetical protein